MGLIFGLVFTPIISSDARLVTLFFLVFTFLHLFSNYHAVSVVSFDAINRQRGHLLIKHQLEVNKVSPSTKISWNFMTPSQVREKEKLFFWSESSPERSIIYGALLSKLELSGLELGTFHSFLTRVNRKINQRVSGRAIHFEFYQTENNDLYKKLHSSRTVSSICTCTNC
jgi:hypothetical protein